MSFGWKVLLPLATLNALVTAIVVVVMTAPSGTPQTRTSSRSSAARSPAAPGGAYRAFGETLRGLKTTFGAASSRA